MKCFVKDCQNETTKNSKYCKIHKAEARKLFFEKIKQNKVERDERYNSFSKIFEDAHNAGMEAANKCIPIPMVVQEHENQLDDNSEVVKEWLVNDGVCGFAWVEIKPGNCSAAHYVKKNILQRKNARAIIFVNYFGQSMQKKQAYANAYASVLNNNGIKAYSYSRMD